MTGQILSGISPLVAVKYQIVVMSMLFGATGISAALYLMLADRRLEHPPQHPFAVAGRSAGAKREHR